MRVQGQDELGGKGPPPHAEVDAVSPDHPPQVEVQPLAGAPLSGRGKEVAHAGVSRQAPSPIDAGGVEGEDPAREGGESGTDVLVLGGEALGEERFHRSVRRAHLPDEGEQARDVAPRHPSVAERPQPPRGVRRVELVDRGRGAGTEDREHGGDAPLDLEHGPEREARRHEADDLPVLRRRLGPDELEGIGVNKAVVVAAVEPLEPPSHLVDTHPLIVADAERAVAPFARRLRPLPRPAGARPSKLPRPRRPNTMRA